MHLGLKKKKKKKWRRRKLDYRELFRFAKTALKIVIWTLTGLLRGVLNWLVKIFCAYFGHIYIFYDVLFRFYHVRCLNILKFGHWFNFLDRKFFWCILTDLLFSRSILTIFDRPFYIARDRAPVSARMIPNVCMRSTKHIE